jgi:hypothetical protein
MDVPARRRKLAGQCLHYSLALTPRQEAILMDEFPITWDQKQRDKWVRPDGSLTTPMAWPEDHGCPRFRGPTMGDRQRGGHLSGWGRRWGYALHSDQAKVAAFRHLRATSRSSACAPASSFRSEIDLHAYLSMTAAHRYRGLRSDCVQATTARGHPSCSPASRSGCR